MNALGRYMRDNDLTREQVAERLTIHLGREVKPLTVQLRSGKTRTPAEWAAVLGLDTSDDGESPDVFVSDATSDPLTDAPSHRADNEPPRKPAAAANHRPAAAAGDYTLVRDRIAKAYGAMGAGASMITQNQGFGAVSDAYSHDIADAWVNAAKENQNVAKIVAFLDSGGPVGELIIAHLILVGGWVYVSGRGPALDFLYAGKFDGYRTLAIVHGNTAAQEPQPDVEVDFSTNGSA